MEKIQQLQQFLHWFWIVSKRYWRSEEAFRAWFLLAMVALFIILANSTNALLNRYQGEFTTALTNKELENFHHSLLLFGGTLMGLIIYIKINNQLPRN